MDKFNDILTNEPLVLVDFFATWCQPCKMMHPILEQLKKQKGDSIRILKVDVDKNHEVAAQYNVQSIPTLLLFRNGIQVWRQTGAMSLKTLSQAIENV